MKMEWPQPLPMSEAPKDAKILAYFGPIRSGWYITKWDEDKGRKWSKPFWCPDGLVLGSLWARRNQPQCWLPLPPKVNMVWKYEVQ